MSRLNNALDFLNGFLSADFTPGSNSEPKAKAISFLRHCVYSRYASKKFTAVTAFLPGQFSFGHQAGDLGHARY